MTIAIRRLADRVRGYLVWPTLDAIRSMPRPPDAAAQIQLQLEYRRLIQDHRCLPRLADVGFKCYSQTDEDGILNFIFALIGTQSKICVEICAGDGIECNTANLILNHGWHGLLVDGDRAAVERGENFYSRSPHTYVFPPRFACSWITRQGVNEMLRANNFVGEIDLLSLDIDGVDYWIWEAIETISPRVVVLEYNDILGPDRNWTVPYSDEFSAAMFPKTDGQANFLGASLGAFVKLGRRKGYRLVGINRYGYNAFFVKNGIGDQLLPEIDQRNCFNHPKVVWGMRERFPTIKDLPWVEV